jgi:hypothetical protein
VEGLQGWSKKREGAEREKERKRKTAGQKDNGDIGWGDRRRRRGGRRGMKAENRERKKKNGGGGARRLTENVRAGRKDAQL